MMQSVQELGDIAQHPLIRHHFPEVLLLVEEAAQPYNEDGHRNGPVAQVCGVLSFLCQSRGMHVFMVQCA